MAAKKKRSAKQLANDKRLGRMAKARAKKKRTAKKKTTRKKATRRRTTRTAHIRKRRPTRRRKKNTRKKATKTVTRTYTVFKCGTKSVQFLRLTKKGKRWVSDRRKALHFVTASEAATVARFTQSATGAAPNSWSKAKILSYCNAAATGKA